MPNKNDLIESDLSKETLKSYLKNLSKTLSETDWTNSRQYTHQKMEDNFFTLPNQSEPDVETRLKSIEDRLSKMENKEPGLIQLATKEQIEFICK